MTNANARQVGGNHYAGKLQHWDLVWHYGLPYFPAQITRYVCRHARKAGLQDLEKALHYTDKYIELLREDAAPGDDLGYAAAAGPAMCLRFVEEQSLPTLESQVLVLLTSTHGVAVVLAAHKAICDIMESTYGVAGSGYVDQDSPYKHSLNRPFEGDLAVYNGETFVYSTHVGGWMLLSEANKITWELKVGPFGPHK